jgi:hypothetical protein
MTVLLLIVVAVLVIAVVRLQHALTDVRDALEAARLGAANGRIDTDRIRHLERRVASLEARLAAADASPPLSQTAGETAPAVSRNSWPQPVRLAAAPIPPERTAVARDGAERTAAAPHPGDIQAAPPATPLPSSVFRPAPVASSVTPPAASTSKAAPAPAADTEAWELVVGTSWLNKIGVVVFVIGVALLLGYSMTHVGPLGRVVMGYALSLAMLGTGIALERRDPYKNYAYGLMGGGWAATYFTAYAMHALPAARVVDSELGATVSLIVVAAGMIAHSLRYRSQTLTGVAFVAAYAPLAFSPLTTFSLMAAVPLTATLLAVSIQFSWSGVGVLGVISAYAIFILRTAVADPTPLSGGTLFVLWIYWLMFEAGDVASRRRRVAAPPAPLFPLNAAGFLGAVLLNAGSGEGQWLLMGGIGGAYLASACARALVLERQSPRPAADAPRPFSSTHAAAALAAALFASAILLRLDGAACTFALLVETQMLVASGIGLADRQLRRIGTAAATLTTLQVLPHAALDASTGFSFVLAVSPVVLIVAAVWYGNAEWLVRRRLAINRIEHLYGWAALMLLVLVVRREISLFYQGVAVLVWSLVLLERGRRESLTHYRQACAALAAGALLTADAFALHISGIRLSPGVSADDILNRHAWFALPAAAALCYGFAGRVLRATGATGGTPSVAAGAAATIGAMFVALFEYRVAPSFALPALWSLTAAAMASTGAWRRLDTFRWHGVALASAAFVLTAPAILAGSIDAPREYAATAGVILGLYLTGYLGGLGATGAARSAAGLAALGGTVLQALFVWRVVPSDLVAPIWAASATALVVLGAVRGRPAQRWQAYGLIVLSTLRALAALGTSPGTVRSAVAGLVAVGLAYLVGYLGRSLPRRAESLTDEERVVAGSLSFLASAHLGAWLHDLLPPSTVAAGYAAAGAALAALGVARLRAGQRWQGYTFLGVTALHLVRDVTTTVADRTPMVLTVFLIVLLYAAGLLLRRGLAHARAEARAVDEDAARICLLVAATVVLTGLLARELDTGLLTLGWGLQGALLLIGGFVARERVLRLSGLALLFLCIAKVFVYDLQQLEALARIVSFVVLGLVLLAVSWIYTRYREQIRRLL